MCIYIYLCICKTESLCCVPKTDSIVNQPWVSDWVKVTQLCPTPCNPMDYTVHGILQARILEWVAVSFSRGSSQPRDRTQVSLIAGGFCTNWAIREAHNSIKKRITLKFLNQRALERVVPLTEIIVITAILLTTYHVPDIIVSAFHAIFCLMFTTTLWNRNL